MVCLWVEPNRSLGSPWWIEQLYYILTNHLQHCSILTCFVLSFRECFGFVPQSSHFSVLHLLCFSDHYVCYFSAIILCIVHIALPQG
ncbi:hypothetical protein BDZ91DRAFT_273068 [Kalaharituber pfeilii]|nr:hypothetical protein BDZ91DRAFT_273068 [Kalaharituber pfeilii]